LQTVTHQYVITPLTKIHLQKSCHFWRDRYHPRLKQLTVSQLNEDYPAYTRSVVRCNLCASEVLTVEVEFVEKRRTYIEQNIVKEPWLAKVVSVNGVELETPVIIEYILIEGTVNKGIKYSFLAFEDIYRLGSPRGWSEEVSQIDYHLRQRLFLKPLNQKQKKEANKSEMATPRKPSD
jgi:hypothetical protein